MRSAKCTKCKCTGLTNRILIFWMSNIKYDNLFCVGCADEFANRISRPAMDSVITCSDVESLTKCGNTDCTRYFYRNWNNT